MRNINSKAPSRVGAYVRKIREQKELSLRHVAEKIGFTTSYLSDFERGNRTAKESTLTKIALALGIPAADIHDAAKNERIAVLKQELSDLKHAKAAGGSR